MVKLLNGYKNNLIFGIALSLKTWNILDGKRKTLTAR